MSEVEVAHLSLSPLPRVLQSTRVKSYSESHLDRDTPTGKEDENFNLEDAESVEGEKTESDQDQYQEEEEDGAEPDPLETPRSPNATRAKSISFSVDEIRAHAFEKLQEELIKAKEALQLKDEQVTQLSKVREEMDQEIVELTANLFQEAHKMVNEANVGQAGAQKLLEEANGKIEVLQAEVQALKALVITSTPSMYKSHSSSPKKAASLLKRKKSNKILSHHRNHSLTGPIQDCPDSPGSPKENGNTSTDSIDGHEQKEADPLLLRDLEAWRAKPSLRNDSAFMKRVFHEDIRPCLNFPSPELSAMLQECVAMNHLSIEPFNGKNPLPQQCNLTEQPRSCPYHIKLGESESWINISSAARDRIAAVCDYYTYLRYIQQGLVKSDLNEMYWEIIRLRKAMSLAKLGIQQ